MESKRAEIIDYLLVQMIGDDLKSGDKLPLDGVLSEYFKTTRINVRKALERLIEMGYIEFQKGKGYFVKPRRLKLDLTMNGNESFSHKMKALSPGYHNGIKTSRYRSENNFWFCSGFCFCYLHIHHRL